MSIPKGAQREIKASCSQESDWYFKLAQLESKAWFQYDELTLKWKVSNFNSGWIMCYSTEIKGGTMSNENESGKEIYKEYLCKWVDAENLNEMVKINESYVFDGRNMVEHLAADKFCNYSMAVINDVDDSFKRAPKTQMINGRKVVAPRYDMPKTGEQCYWLNLGYTQGFQTYDAESMSYKEKRVLKLNGWFDNENNIVAHVNAHRESK